MDENFDFEIIPEKPGMHKLRLALAAAVFGLTAFLVFYSIYLSAQSVKYYVSIDGSGVVQKGQAPALRFSAIGMLEQMPLSHLAVRVDLEKEDGGRLNLFKQYSNGEPYIWWVGDLPSEMGVGEHRLKLRVSTIYGPEDNEFSLTVSEEAQPSIVQLAELEEAYLKRSKPLEIPTAEGTLLLRMIPNNGRYVPSLLNEVLVSFEYRDSPAAPVAGFKFGVRLGNDLLAELVTDEAGLARFSYYPSGLTSHKLNISTVLSDNSTFEGEYEMFPWGAQIVADVKQHFIEAGQPLQFGMTTLRPGKWLVDVYRKGNLIMHSAIESDGARKPVSLKLPSGADGLLYVQIAADSDNPTHAFEAFFVYVCGRNETALLSALEKALRSEAAFYGPEIIDIEMLDNWSRRRASVAESETLREELAARLLSDLPKRYIVLPDLMDTRESKVAGFEENNTFKRRLALFVLALCGLSVVLYLGNRIRQELRNSKRRGFGMDFRPNQALQLAIALIAVSVTYIALLYILSSLNWHLGI